MRNTSKGTIINRVIRTSMWALSLLSLAIVLSAGGCGPAIPEMEMEGGKAEVTEPGTCMTRDAMIEMAQSQLIEDEPDFDDRAFDESSVEIIEDLNGDGSGDAIILPGVYATGSNEIQMVYLSGRDGCPTRYAGTVGVTNLTPTEEVHHGVRDLLGVNISGCTRTMIPLIFNGELYEEGEITEDLELCEENWTTEH